MPTVAPPRPSRDPAVAVWLFACAFFVAAMVAVGGLTRLTRSGLSIVEWKPILGALPPLGDAAWQAEFARYQATPEFRLINTAMTLEGFKEIYWVEWAHRLLGRLTGLVVIGPLVFFLWRKRVDKARALRVVGLFVLGGLQGFLGWFMVKSGLVNQPHVSPYRLTSHLLLALVVFAGLMWVALDAVWDRPAGETARSLAPLRRAATALLALLGITITWGGLMAGFHAGLVAPTFPTMNTMWIPAGLWLDSPAIVNPVANPIAIHFTHRLLAYLVVAAAVALAIAVRRAEAASPRARALAIAVLAVACLQVTLGAVVVLSFVRIAWASLHQVNAVLLLAVVVGLRHQLAPARSA